MSDVTRKPLSDVAAVRAVLIAAARSGRPINYASALDALGYAFSRPKMRALCRTLGAVDDGARAAGEPDLAVLVVRASDGLPGQGWWVGEAGRLGYEGPWTGPEAVKFIRRRQKLAFDHWGAAAGKSPRRRRAGP